MNSTPQMPCLSLLGSPLGAYRIVHSAKATDLEQYFIMLLQDRLRRVGYELDVVTDSAEPAEREIVIGNTTRSGSADFYEKPREVGEYAIIGKGGSLYVGYGSVLCLLEVLADMEQVYDRDTVCIARTVPDTFCLQKTREDDIRVMSSNVEYVKWSDQRKDYRLRMRMIAQYYNMYLPDFIGLQEACGQMREALYPYVAPCYREVDFARYTAEAIKLEYLPILYNAEKWRVVDAGAGRWKHRFVCAWGYGWVKFCRIDDENDVFYMMNLHYMPAPFVEKYGEMYRYGIAEEINERVKELIANDPDAMIAITGDYNGARDSDLFAVMSENGFLETSYLLTEDTNLSAERQANWIDHISVTKENTEVRLNRSVDTIGIRFTSDHTSCFSDIRRRTKISS